MKSAERLKNPILFSAQPDRAYNAAELPRSISPIVLLSSQVRMKTRVRRRGHYINPAVRSKLFTIFLFHPYWNRLSGELSRSFEYPTALFGERSHLQSELPALAWPTTRLSTLDYIRFWAPERLEYVCRDNRLQCCDGSAISMLERSLLIVTLSRQLRSILLPMTIHRCYLREEVAPVLRRHSLESFLSLIDAILRMGSRLFSDTDAGILVKLRSFCNLHRSYRYFSYIG